MESRTLNQEIYSLKKFLEAKEERTSNVKCSEYVKNRLPFRASNLSSNYINGCYVVLSYEWYPLFVFKEGIWYENSEKYSASTSREQIHAGACLWTEKRTQKELKELIYG